MENRNFIGIGKILFDTPTEEWNIPKLHFIVSKCDETTYEAINLEFGLVSIGETGLEAAEGLADLSSSYLNAVIKDGNGFKELQELVRKNFLYDLWGEFRGIEFELAETSNDLSHHSDKAIVLRERETKEVLPLSMRSSLEYKEKRVA